MITYDPRGMTWDEYCKLMAELFAANQLGYVEEAYPEFRIVFVVKLLNMYW